jgi:hypothetical protein
MRDGSSRRNRLTRGLTMAGVVGAMVVGFLPLGLGVTAAGAATATGGQYVPITPVRIADTRTGSTFPNAGQTMAAGGSVTVALPSSVAGASAVALNVTATNTTGSGFFTVYPAGGTLPLASSLNYAPGANVPNFVIVPVGANNSITIYNGPPGGDGSTGGAADAVVDLQGSFNTVANTSGGAGHFNPLTPARITDTRAGSGQTNAGSTLTPGGTLTVQATGEGGVPATGVSAVEVNVTEAANTAGGFLTVFPQGNTAPTVSNLNFVSGQIVANRVIVPVNPANGQFSIFNHAGNTDVVVDVDGYFTDSTGASGAGSLFNPAPVARVIDTRSGSPIGPNGNLNVPITGIPAGASAAVLNVTEASNTAGGFLTVSPTTPAPLASDVNFVPGVIVANGDIAALAPDGSLNVYNHDGNTNVVLDVAGYFTPSSGPVPVNGTSVALSATPTSLVANGATSALVATVTNATTGPVSGDTVTFSSTGVCGTIAPASGSSSATGTVDATYTSSSSAGDCTITATEGANGAASNPVVITQTALPTTYHTVVAASPTLVTTSGPGNTSVVTVTVTGPGNSPISGDQVEVLASNASASALNTCGSLVAIPPPAPLLPTNFSTTDATGKATFTYTSGSLIGNCTITAIEANQGTSGNTGTTAITQALQGYSITDVASPSFVIANGSLVTHITATVLHNGTPANADAVTFATVGTGDPAGTCGTVPATSVNTVSGQASITYTSPDLSTGIPATSGFCSVSATEALGSTTTLVPALVDNQGGSPAVVVAVNATPNIISAGVTTSAVTATVTGASATGIVGDEVLFTVSGPCTITSPTPPFEATTGGGVTAAVTVAGAAAGTCTVTATESNSGKTGSTSITVNPIVNSVAVTASPSAITGNGITTSSITATVTGPSVAGDSVTFSVVSAITGLATGCGTIPPTAVIVNASGQAVDTYTSSANAGFCIVTATESATGSSGSTQIDQTSV